MLALTRQMTAVIFDSRLISSPDPDLATGLAIQGKQYFSEHIPHIPAIKPIKHLCTQKEKYGISFITKIF